MHFTIRFLPICPTDPSPALYLSGGVGRVDGPRGRSAPMVSLTALQRDVATFPRGEADVRLASQVVARRCVRDKVQVEAVPISEARADLGEVELRPRSMREAYRALTTAEVVVLGFRRLVEDAHKRAPLHG